MSGILNVWDPVSQSYKPMPALVGRGIKAFSYDATQDKWIVTYTDGTTEAIQGPTVEGGASGFSPMVEFAPIDGGYRLSITDVEGTKTVSILNGEDGQQGPQGPAGPTGSQGPKGDTGPEGPKGETGETGPEGPQGPQGEQGPTGKDGAKGDKGDKGDTGPTGPQGPKGDTGKQGPEGPQGPKGDTGEQGPEGPQGPKGDTGKQGPEGPQGPKGDTGEQGPEGPQGPKGDTGKQGPEGPQGPKGDTGDTGPAGADGKTPVKGTDYFTEADKQEIAQAAAALVEVPEGFSGDYNDLQNTPSAFPPATHNQSASTITAGTFAGQVVANSSAQTPGTSLLRNSRLGSVDTAPTVNGEICWKYE